MICLSEAVRNDTLLDVEMRVSRECRRELRVELLERVSSVRPPVCDSDLLLCVIQTFSCV